MKSKFQIPSSRLQTAFFLFVSSLFLTVLVGGFFISSVYASSHCGANPEYLTDFGCLPENPAQFGSALYSIGLGFIGAVALLFIVYGGYLILTSQGSVDQLSKGKSYIFYAIAGIILAVSGYALYQAVAADVLKIPGFNK